MWVRSRYTSELAVLAAWVSLFIPWNVTYHTSATVQEAPAAEGTMFVLRFALFELQLREKAVTAGNIQVGNFAEFLEAQYAGVNLFGGLYITSPPTATRFYEGTLSHASLLWTVAAVAFALAVALSLALYFRTETTTARLPVSEVRLMGSLLGAATLALAGSSYLYFQQRDIVGTPIPVGVVVIGALAAVLLVTSEVTETAE
jgi:hypothetical protein